VALADGFPVRPAREDESELMGALRTWRTERARADAVPAFVVAHDSMLAAIVEARPTTLAALRRVKGMGPMKLERYGVEILDVVQASI
jgi:superfamily II DNA helicase RecQ